jgi:tubulin polyglutamylase TTLL6/13
LVFVVVIGCVFSVKKVVHCFPFQMAKGANAQTCSAATPSDDSDDEDPVSSQPSFSRAAPQKKAPRKRFVIINLSKCRYHIVRQAAHELGWCIEDEERAEVAPVYAKSEDHTAVIEKLFPCFRYRPEESPQIHWVDCSVLLPRVAALKCFQRLNHFPNMHLLCRKMLFFSRCMKMRERFPEWYTFFPKSYSLRTDEKALQDEVRSLRGKVKTFLMKPNAGCQG